jgi:hypothetical protein
MNISINKEKNVNKVNEHSTSVSSHQMSHDFVPKTSNLRISSVFKLFKIFHFC